MRRKPYLGVCMLRSVAAFRPIFGSKTHSLLLPRRHPSQRRCSCPAMNLIDVDCNLWHEDLQKLVLQEDEDCHKFFRILNQDDLPNVIAMLCPSSTLVEARAGLEALDGAKFARPVLRTTVGVHPYHVNDSELQTHDLDHYRQELQQLVTQYPQHIAAIGECGLDASDGFPSIQDQVPWFAMQVQVAQTLQLPLFVHERLAARETLQLLDEVQNVPIIIHCFTGTADECRVYMDRNYFISISGFIYKGEPAAGVIEALEEGIVDLDRLMIETDAPYLGFDGCRERYLQRHRDHVQSLGAKKRRRLQGSQYPNPPSSIYKVLEKVLHHVNVGRNKRGQDELTSEELANKTTRTANRFFGFGVPEV